MKCNVRSSTWLRFLILTGILVTFFSACTVVSYAPTHPPRAKYEKPIRCSSGMAWVPGHWEWHSSKWLWIPSFCKKKPRQHAVWIPGRWEEKQDGWVWIPGHWRG